jgi:hypothetical protein
MDSKVNVLHLTDLHFGLEESETALIQRQNAIEELLRTLEELDREWKPDVLVVSGDIGWKGARGDYVQARKWLAHLLRTLDLTSDHLIICAGNHDVDRDASIQIYPATADDADKRLAVDNPRLHTDLTAPFKHYVSFCRELGIPSLSLGKRRYVLMGHRVVEDLNLRFVVLNSAWFSHSDEDEGKLWIGLPQLEVMHGKFQLVRPERYDEDLITLAVLHHPRWSMALAENTVYGRPATYYYLADRCHIILTGHEHGEPSRPDIFHGGAYLFKGGASYLNNRYRNNFSIFQIRTEARTATRRVFEYNPGTQKWVERQDTRHTYSLYQENIPLLGTPDLPQGSKEGKISIQVTDKLQERNLLFGVRHVQDGLGEDVEVFNRDYVLTKENGNKYSIGITYAEGLGFQFKSFVHYGNNDFVEIRELLEEGGFWSVSQDLMEPRAWFLLPDYPVFRARGDYDNNIFYPS